VLNYSSMATQLKDYEFSKRGRKSGSKYDKFLDGQIWKLRKGADFLGDADGVRTTLYRLAKQKEIKVRISVSRDPDNRPTIIVQAYEEDRSDE